MGRKRKREKDDDGQDRAMEKDAQLAKDNCYVDTKMFCNSQIGVAERKVTRLKVGRGDCRIGLVSGGTPF